MSQSKLAFDGVISELESMSLFSGYSREKIGELCADSVIQISQHREKLFNYNEIASKFGIVLSGAYKLSRPTPQGDDVIVHFSATGDVVGAFIMGRPEPVYPVTVTAMGPSRFLCIPRDNYLKKWQTEAKLLMRIQGLLSTRMAMMQSQKAMLKAPLGAKIAALLLNLVSKKSDAKSLTVLVPLTRKEIADSLGVTVESVIRIMSVWSKQGYVATNDQSITILAPDKLIENMSLD